MEVLEQIANWRSIRRYKEDPVPDGALRAMLEAARRAPSWENVQPWHFIVVTDPAAKEKLKELARGQKHIGRAPAVIACCGDIGAWDKPKNKAAIMELVGAGVMKVTEDLVDNFLLKDPMFCVAENGPAVILARTMEQLAIAYGFMALEAAHQGLGTCMIGAFGNEVIKGNEGLYKEVKELLGLPEDHYLLAMLTVGYPAEEPKLRPRKAFEKIASRGAYGNAF
ncbi:MAG: nitroreductase family protein [bacterium]